MDDAAHRRPLPRPDLHRQQPAGAKHLRRLVPQAAEALRPGGLLALEMGAAQGAAVAAVIEGTNAFGAPRVRPDLAGRDRFVLAERLLNPD